MQSAMEEELRSLLATTRHRDAEEDLRRLDREFARMTGEMGLPAAEAKRLIARFFHGFDSAIASVETILLDLEAANSKTLAEAASQGRPVEEMIAQVHDKVVADQTCGDNSGIRERFAKTFP